MKKLALACAAALGLSALMAPSAVACPPFQQCYEEAQIVCAEFHAVGSSGYWLCVDDWTDACIALNGGCS